MLFFYSSRFSILLHSFSSLSVTPYVVLIIPTSIMNNVCYWSTVCLKLITNDWCWPINRPVRLSSIACNALVNCSIVTHDFSLNPNTTSLVGFFHLIYCLLRPGSLRITLPNLAVPITLSRFLILYRFPFSIFCKPMAKVLNKKEIDWDGWRRQWVIMSWSMKICRRMIYLSIRKRSPCSRTASLGSLWAYFASSHNSLIPENDSGAEIFVTHFLLILMKSL